MYASLSPHFFLSGPFPCLHGAFWTFTTLLILRAICEVAATPDHEDGLFGEIVNVILNASASIGSEMGDLVSWII